MTNILYKEESYAIVGALFEVYNNLGSGFSEIVYKDALEYEFNLRKISFSREREFSVTYKNHTLPINIMLILFSRRKSFWKSNQ